MVLVPKPINQNCSFALTLMTNRDRVVLNDGTRKRWQECDICFCEWLVLFFYHCFFQQEEKQQMSKLPCCAVRNLLIHLQTEESLPRASWWPVVFKTLCNCKGLGLRSAADCHYRSSLLFVSSVASNIHSKNTDIQCHYLSYTVPGSFILVFIWQCQNV